MMAAASYEVVTAYTATTYNKRLRFYNTEAGLHAGAQPATRPGQDPADHDLNRALGWMNYNQRDMLLMLAYVPDKVGSRAAHHVHDNPGDETGFRFLRELRGRLVETRSPLPGVWCVAARNSGRLCVVAYNDNSRARTFPLVVEAPAGCRFKGGFTQWIDVVNKKLKLTDEPLAATGARWTGEAAIAPRSAAKWVFELQGDRPGSAAPPPGAPAVIRSQHYAPEILRRVEQSRPVEMKIAIPEPELRRAKSAVLRLVLEGWSPPRGQLTINGQAVEVRMEDHGIHDQAIDVALLKPVNMLVFGHKDAPAAPPGGRVRPRAVSLPGYDVDAVSLIVSQE